MVLNYFKDLIKNGGEHGMHKLIKSSISAYHNQPLQIT